MILVDRNQLSIEFPLLFSCFLKILISLFPIVFHLHFSLSWRSSPIKLFNQTFCFFKKRRNSHTITIFYTNKIAKHTTN